jgi:hypothetical protein
MPEPMLLRVYTQSCLTAFHPTLQLLLLLLLLLLLVPCQARERIEADLGDPDSRFRHIDNLSVHVKVRTLSPSVPCAALQYATRSQCCSCIYTFQLDSRPHAHTANAAVFIFLIVDTQRL